MSNLGRWSNWYADPVIDPIAYADTESYGYAATWLGECVSIEDWGCGWGFFRERSGVDPDLVVNIDGTENQFVDRVVDLCQYRPDPGPDGINIRHVLEHNWCWQDLLQNACSSAGSRIFLSVFTPEPLPEHPLVMQLDWIDELGVPDLAIADDPIDAIFGAHLYRYAKARIATDTTYGIERLWFAIR